MDARRTYTETLSARFNLSASLGAMAAEEQNAGEATDLKELCKEMFDKITQYLNGELTGIIYGQV